MDQQNSEALFTQESYDDPPILDLGPDLPYHLPGRWEGAETREEIGPLELPEKIGPLESRREWPCLVPGCKQKPFTRYADLDRHAKHVHPEKMKDPYPCDYKKCNRRNDPFYRKDHYRDHLREYHREDLSKRGNNDAARLVSHMISPDWWRCSRCLTRVVVVSAEFVCLSCGHKCESDRKAARLAKAEETIAHPQVSHGTFNTAR